MDPFSLGTGVVGVIGVALQVTITLKDYVSGWREASVTIKSLQTELKHLRNVLENLDSLLSSHNLHFHETSVLYVGTRECVENLRQLQIKLENIGAGNRAKKTLGYIKWPFSENKTLQVVEDVRKHVQLFEFALNINQWWEYRIYTMRELTNYNSRLLMETSDTVTSQLEETLRTLDIVKAHQIDEARGMGELSGKLSAILTTISSLPENSRQIQRLSQGMENMTRFLDGMTGQ
jgi:hypothetical protein